MNSLQVIQQTIVILLFLFGKLLRMNFACIMLQKAGLLKIKKLRYSIVFQDLTPYLFAAFFLRITASISAKKRDGAVQKTAPHWV